MHTKKNSQPFLRLISLMFLEFLVCKRSKETNDIAKLFHKKVINISQFRGEIRVQFLIL